MSGGGMEQRRVPKSYLRSIQPQKPESISGLSSDQYKEMIIAQPQALRLISPKDRSEELCLFAMTQQGFSSVESWVENNPDVFPYLVPELMSEIVCLAFFRSDYVENHRLYGDWSKGISYDGKNSVKQLPFKHYMRWESVCKAAVEKCGLMLKGVPSSIITMEICEMAVDNSPWAIKYVPAKLLNRELCLKAVNSEPMVARYIPTKFNVHDL